MAGLFHHDCLYRPSISFCNIICILFILFFIFANITLADNAYKSNGRGKAGSGGDGNGRYGNDEVQAHKVKNHIILDRDGEPTYENVQGTPSHSSQHTSKLLSDSAYSYHQKQKYHVNQVEKEPVSKVVKEISDAYYGHHVSANSAAALATFEASPSNAIQKQLTLRKRHNLAVSSIEDWKLENLVLFVTVDGTIHARSRDAGKDLWRWPTTPLIQSKRHKRRTRVAGGPHNPDDDIEWIVEAVNGGQLYWYSHESGLTKLPLSIREFVDLAPYEADGKVYNGEKRTEVYNLDPRTGALLFTSELGTIDNSCRRMGLEALDDDECSNKKITLGKTEYTVKIMNEDELLWTIKYTEWGPGTQDALLGDQYRVSLDHKYFMALHNGHVIVRDLSKLGQKEILDYKFDSPVVQGFDVATRSVQTENGDSIPLVLLPQPTDSTYGNGEGEKCYISYFGDSGYFAMSEENYPGNTGGAGRAIGTDPRRTSSKPQWIKMDDADRKEYLSGVHELERSNEYLPEMILRSPDNFSQNKDRQLRGRQHMISAYPHPHEESSYLTRENIMIILLLALGLYFTREKFNSFVLPKRLIAKTAKGAVPTPPEVSDIDSDVPMLQDPIRLVESDIPLIPSASIVVNDEEVNMPADEGASPAFAPTSAAPTPPAAPIAEEEAPRATAVRFVEPEPEPEPEPAPQSPPAAAEEGSSEPKDEPKKAPKKARRGMRGGAKKKRQNGSIGEKDLVDVGAHDNPANTKVDLEAKAVIHNPEVLTEPVDGITRAGDLEVTEQILGYGSHGTIVLKGSWEGREVAVKRMLIGFYDMASHEINLLQKSDDHPNVVRYYCKQLLGQFLYIALELCPASLHDVMEKPSQFENILRHMHPPDVLYQIGLGVQHLHSLKMVHRDIKPHNILVTAPKQSLKDPEKITPPRLLISDFGLCKMLEHDQSSFRATTAHAAGTTGWRAPELLLNEDDGQPIIATTEDSATGSTSGGIVLDALTNRRATRAIDIFSLGCVFYYVLTKGHHPFGDRYMREANIINDVQKMIHLEVLGDAGLEAKDLILRMVRRNPKERPDATTVLMHPFFWSSEKKLNFLLDVSDRFEVEEREPPSPLLQLLEEGSSEILGSDWLKRLDKVFIDNLGKYRKYNGTKLLDLLRALRNKKHHYQDLPPNVKAALGELPDGFLEYFTSRFPKLIMHTYYVVRGSELRHESTFRNIFNPV